jgi:Mg2+-importing ATPase
MNRTSATEPTGLTIDEAEALLRQWGPNEFAAAGRTSALSHLRTSFAHPLALILLAAAAVSAAVGDAASAGLIAVVVLIGGAINFVQTYRSQVAMERMRAGVAPTATVRRDGRWIELPRARVVPGDVIRLSAGDLVPADASLLDAHDLHVQQAALTGESVPVEKSAGGNVAVQRGEGLRPDRPDAVFLGTSVVSGTAVARVLATGLRTAFGEVAARLAERAPETEFDRGLRRFGLFISEAVVLLVFAVLLAGVTFHRDPLQTLLFAVALAVGLTPEFLPMIVAVTLARGAVRMSRSHVVVKHLAAIENLGSIDVLCSDKTGTLTRGEMELAAVTDPHGGPSEKAFLLAYLNSTFETGIKSPLDAAILRHATPDVRAFAKVDEVPFDFERRRLSVVVAGPDGHWLITKGAPEHVVACSTSVETPSGPAPLDHASREDFTAYFRDRSAEGLRLLAVAYRPVPACGTWHAADEHDLILVGLLAFLDPPRPDAADAVRALHRDGVRVVVLTGDNELITKYVCSSIGLGGGDVVLGAELDRLGDGALGALAERAPAFARLTPAHKTRILHALKSRGHVVGFLGDGINDAPSLHASDVGISVSGAVDVAKDAAEIILLEPGLGVLHNGIREGRRAFGNVMKYLLMGTSSNFGNMLSMAAATLFLPFLPMLPVQVLLNSLLYDLAQLTIPTDEVDVSFLHKPRRWDIDLIRRFMVRIGPVSSLFDLLTFAALLWVFHAGEPEFHTGWFVESLATQTLVLFVIRTAHRPWHSRPSRALIVTVLAVVLIGVWLPYSPFAGAMGFVRLPVAYLAFVAAATAAYLSLVEVAKPFVLRRAWR